MNIIDTNCQSLIDTVHFELPSEYLSLDWKEDRNNEYGFSTRARKKNMNIYWNNGKLRVQGSLSKYFNGNNFNCLKLSEIEKAVSILQNELKIDLSNATLSRVDLAGNIYLKENISEYFACLANYRNLKRISVGSTLYFMKGKQYSKAKIAFYDKVAELGKHNAKRLGIFGHNIMRYEIRLYKEDIRRIFKFSLLLKNLSNEEINKNLNALWLNEYENIKKYSSSQLTFKEGFGDKELIAAFAKQGMNYMGGFAESLKLLESSKEYQGQRAENRLRRRKVLEKINSVDSQLIDNGLLNELNNAVSNYSLKLL